MVTTYTLSFLETNSQGVPLVGATILIELTAADYTSESAVLPSLITLTTDALGEATVNLVPNVSGNQATQYRVRILNAQSVTVDDILISMPASNATFRSLTESVTPSSLTQAQQTLTQAQATLASANTSATNAAASETASATSETNAAASETAAGSSATNAAASETAAGTSETNAATSETNAAASASTASSASTSANTDKTAAAASATAAGTSETNAAGSASAASTSASSAVTSASSASSSETAAGTSETNAASSETAAATSETNSATSASASNTSALASAVSAAAALDSQGDSALSASASATSASGSSTNATNAATSETNAAASETAASSSETNAAASETAAALSETNAANSEAAADADRIAAAASQTSASTSATSASADRVLAETAKTAAQLAESNAVAVVSGGIASLTAESGKIPIADAQGKIDDSWLSYNIPALQEVLTGLNVVAVAYYDTANDSDGGEWIKRTGLVFTPQMLIVITASNEIYYDISGASVTEIKNVSHSPLVLSSISVSEGNVYIGMGAGVLHRNLFADTLVTIDSVLVNTVVNDIAVTVLDNAPIDNETGLRIPTVLVGCGSNSAGGFSIIDNDGSVRSLTLAFQGVKNVAFGQDNDFFYTRMGYDGWLVHADLNTFISQSVNYVNSGFTGRVKLYDQDTAPLLLKSLPTGANVSDLAATPNGFAYSKQDGIAILHENPSDPTKGMVAHITDKYATGYMVGDTQLAALCDTETGSIVETNLITGDDSTFTTTVGGWTVAGGATQAIVSGELEVTNTAGGGAEQSLQTFNLVIGDAYVLKAKGRKGTGTNVRLRISDNGLNLSESISVGTITAFSPIPFVATEATMTIALRSEGVGTGYFDDVTLDLATPDRSGNDKHLQLHGTLNRSVIGSGEIAAWSGWSVSNYLAFSDDANLNFGTGDFSVTVLLEHNQVAGNSYVFGSADAAFGVGGLYLRYKSNGELIAYFNSTLTAQTLSGTTSNSGLVSVTLSRKGGVATLSANQLTLETKTILDAVSIRGAQFGIALSDNNQRYRGKAALLSVSKTAPSPDQIKKIHRDELAMLQGGAVLDGNDPDIKAITYDKSLQVIHAASQGTISTFRGLERISSSLDGVAELNTNANATSPTNETDATTGIAIRGGSELLTSIANTDTEGGSFAIHLDANSVVNGSWNIDLSAAPYNCEEGERYRLKIRASKSADGDATKIGMGGTDLGTDVDLLSLTGIDTWLESDTYFTYAAATRRYLVCRENGGTNDAQSQVSYFSLRAITKAAPITSLTSDNGNLIIVGNNGFDVDIPAVSIRERLQRAITDQSKLTQDFFFTGDASKTDWDLPKGWKPKRVHVDGSKKREGSAEDYTIIYDGFDYSISFAVAPALDAEIDVEGVSI